MLGKLLDGSFPLTVHADESMVYHSYLALINLTTQHLTFWSVV